MKKHIIAFCGSGLVVSLLLGLSYMGTTSFEVVGIVIAGFISFFLFVILYFLIYYSLKFADTVL